jgi:GTP pyrophosphokinase
MTDLIPNFTKLHSEYQALAPSLNSCCSAVEKKLSELISRQALTLAMPLGSRVKEWDSLAEKIKRKGASINSVQDFNDLIGLRAVFLFSRDIRKAMEIIKQEFEVISEENTEVRLQDKEFGYRSFHLIIKVHKNSSAEEPFNKLPQFRAELQIRTMAQHIWASASHKLQYKYEDGVPIPVRRSIHRVSALLEVVDLEFERVLQEKKEYSESINMAEDTLLNVDVLIRLLDEKLPQQNKGSVENYADLLQDLNHFEVMTTGDLSNIIQKHLKQVLEVDKRMIDSYSRMPENQNALIKERIKRGIFLYHTGLVREMMNIKFGGDVWIPYAKQVISDRMFK